MAQTRLILLGAAMHTCWLPRNSLRCGMREYTRCSLLRDGSIIPGWRPASFQARCPGANRIDVEAVAKRRGLSYVAGSATAIDPTARSVTLADGGKLGFDLLSLIIGSTVAEPGRKNDVWPVKPLAGLTALRAHIESRSSFPRLLIAGAGPSGIEVAAALAGLATRSDSTFPTLATCVHTRSELQSIQLGPDRKG